MGTVLLVSVITFLVRICNLIFDTNYVEMANGNNQRSGLMR